MPHETFRAGPGFRAAAWTGAIVIGALVAIALFCAGWALAAFFVGP